MFFVASSAYHTPGGNHVLRFVGPSGCSAKKLHQYTCDTNNKRSWLRPMEGLGLHFIFVLFSAMGREAQTQS